MNLLCLCGLHDWRWGCKCRRCLRTRDAEHSWSKNCEACSTCGKTRTGVHSWSACVCATCGTKRDAEHRWNGCVCPTCGRTRDQEHRFDGCVCSTCHAEKHDLQLGGAACARCGRLLAAEDVVLTRLERSRGAGVAPAVFDALLRSILGGSIESQVSRLRRLGQASAMGGPCRERVVAELAGLLESEKQWAGDGDYWATASENAHAIERALAELRRG